MGTSIYWGASVLRIFPKAEEIYEDWDEGIVGFRLYGEEMHRIDGHPGAVSFTLTPEILTSIKKTFGTTTIYFRAENHKEISKLFIVIQNVNFPEKPK